MQGADLPPVATSAQPPVTIAVPHDNDSAAAAVAAAAATAAAAGAPDGEGAGPPGQAPLQAEPPWTGRLVPKNATHGTCHWCGRDLTRAQLYKHRDSRRLDKDTCPPVPGGRPRAVSQPRAGKRKKGRGDPATPNSLSDEEEAPARRRAPLQAPRSPLPARPRPPPPPSPRGTGSGSRRLPAGAGNATAPQIDPPLLRGAAPLLSWPASAVNMLPAPAPGAALPTDPQDLNPLLAGQMRLPHTGLLATDFGGGSGSTAPPLCLQPPPPVWGSQAAVDPRDTSAMEPPWGQHLQEPVAPRGTPVQLTPTASHSPWTEQRPSPPPRLHRGARHAAPSLGDLTAVDGTGPWPEEALGMASEPSDPLSGSTPATAQVEERQAFAALPWPTLPSPRAPAAASLGGPPFHPLSGYRLAPQAAGEAGANAAALSLAQTTGDAEAFDSPSNTPPSLWTPTARSGPGRPHAVSSGALQGPALLATATARPASVLHAAGSSTPWPTSVAEGLASPQPALRPDFGPTATRSALGPALTMGGRQHAWASELGQASGQGAAPLPMPDDDGQAAARSGPATTPVLTLTADVFTRQEQELQQQEAAQRQRLEARLAANAAAKQRAAQAQVEVDEAAAGLAAIQENLRKVAAARRYQNQWQGLVQSIPSSLPTTSPEFKALHKQGRQEHQVLVSTLYGRLIAEVGRLSAGSDADLHQTQEAQEAVAGLLHLAGFYGTLCGGVQHMAEQAMMQLVYRRAGEASGPAPQPVLAAVPPGDHSGRRDAGDSGAGAGHGGGGGSGGSGDAGSEGGETGRRDPEPSSSGEQWQTYVAIGPPRPSLQGMRALLRYVCGPVPKRAGYKDDELPRPLGPGVRAQDQRDDRKRIDRMRIKERFDVVLERALDFAAMVEKLVIAVTGVDKGTFFSLTKGFRIGEHWRVW